MKKIFVIVVLLILLSGYWISFNRFGNKETTITNQPVSTVLTTRPRLQDDFYEYINYEYLNKNQLGEDEIAHYNSDCTEKIEKEKEIIIDELLSNNNAVGIKINNFYYSYMENAEENSINELKQYIDKINNSQNIEEFVENAIDVNYELSTDILISPNVLFNPKGESEKYFGFDLITYDWDNTVGYYTIEDYEYTVRMYKKYDVQILKKYGYTSNEAIEIAERVQSMYTDISRFSELNQNKLLENGYKVYTIEELQAMLNNIPLNKVTSYYSEFCKGTDKILVVDINQLKMIDSYLVEENLQTLKEYATLKILTTYSEYISEDYFKIYSDYMCESQNYIMTEEYTKEEIGYKQIYSFFKDTVTEKFADKYFSSEQKEFYRELIETEIEIYKTRIKDKEWLSEETKKKAITKMENMTFTVGLSDNLVKVENKYNIAKENSYMNNVINIKQNLKNEEMKQYKKGNITYNLDEIDQLTVNAFYMPNNNSINLLLGYIYSLTETFNLKQDKLEQDYYKILGSMGATIGHELSHALDTSGAKYDANGNYINWWNEEDEYNFNSLTSKVVKYYENFEQFGDTTIGENIADLGGIAIVLQIAENNNATEEDYKTLFESYARNWASQCTTIYKEYMLRKDVHSPEENRVNAVLSTLNKFYEIYNIKDTDKMYIKLEDRVSVW